jgi:hypothetical protein
MSASQLVELFEIALSQPDPDVPGLAPSSLGPRARGVRARNGPRELVALWDLLPRREVVGPAAQGIDILEPLIRRLEFLGVPRRIGLEWVPRDRVRIVLRVLVPGLPLEGLCAGVIARAITVIAGASLVIAGVSLVIAGVSLVIAGVSLVIAGVSILIAGAITLT